MRVRSSLLAPLALAFALAASTAAAREMEIVPSAGFRWGGQVEGGGSADLEPGVALGLSWGWRVRPDAWLEVLWSHEESEFTLPPFTAPGGTFGLDVDYLHFGSTYEPGSPNGGAQPFVGASAGLTRLAAEEPGFGHEEGFSLAAFGGATFPLGPRTGLRLAARGWFTFVDASFAGTCGGTACSFALSGDGAAQADVTLGFVFRLGSQAGAASP